MLPSWALPTLENREKGKGWSKNALLLTIAVQNVFILRGECEYLELMLPKVTLNSHLGGLESGIAIPSASFIGRVLLGKCEGIGSVGGAP